MWYLLPTGAGTSWAARHVSGRILTRTGHVSCAWFCDHEETVLKGAYKDASRRQSQSDSPAAAAVYFRPAAAPPPCDG